MDKLTQKESLHFFSEFFSGEFTPHGGLMLDTQIFVTIKRGPYLECVEVKKEIWSGGRTIYALLFVTYDHETKRTVKRSDYYLAKSTYKKIRRQLIEKSIELGVISKLIMPVSAYI